MKVRLFDKEKDYEKVKTWAKGWKTMPLPKEYLPPYGLMVSNNGIDVCVGWIFRTDGGMCLFDGVIIDPKAPKPRRKGALPLLALCLQSLARQLGHKTAIVSTKNAHIRKIMEDTGFSANKELFVTLSKAL